MIPVMLKLPTKLMTSCMAAASMIVVWHLPRIKKCPPGRPGRTGIAVKMVNAVNQAMMVKTAARRTLIKWIVAKMVSAANPVMMERIAAKHLINHYINYGKMKKMFFIALIVLVGFHHMHNLQKQRCRQQVLPAPCAAMPLTKH